MKDDTLLVVLVAVGAFIVLPRLMAPPLMVSPPPTTKPASASVNVGGKVGTVAGAGIGAFFGQPQLGASIGQTVGSGIQTVGGAIGDFFGSIF